MSPACASRCMATAVPARAAQATPERPLLTSAAALVCDRVAETWAGKRVVSTLAWLRSPSPTATPMNSPPPPASPRLTESPPKQPEQPSPRLSGPGTSRQARRLQLRNAGFRASPIPPRRVTPLATSPPPTSPEPTPPRGGRRSLRVKSRSVAGTRRSASGEARSYVEHVETELAAAEARLRALNSPTLTREHKARERNLRQEIRRLHADVAGWEAKYEERVDEAVRDAAQRSHAAELALRQAKDTLIQLQHELEMTRARLAEVERQRADAEAANEQIEKRFEIVSGLLAESPTRVDISAPPGRHSRPVSMVPLFPTARVAVSPDRHSQTLPSSPMTPVLVRATSPTSESLFSPRADDSPTTSSWQGFQARNRPRRMRRFGGSIALKPLILPTSSSACDTDGSPMSRRATLSTASSPSELGTEVTPTPAATLQYELREVSSSTWSSPWPHSPTHCAMDAGAMPTWHRMARQLVSTVNRNPRLSGTLRGVQWWLVGVLLGPMTRNRLLPPLTPPPSRNPSRPDIMSGPGKRICNPETEEVSKHSPWLWLKFTLTLALAVGVAFKDGPASLMAPPSPRRASEQCT